LGPLLLLASGTLGASLLSAAQARRALLHLHLLRLLPLLLAPAPPLRRVF
jgi:hypothetical protein